MRHGRTRKIGDPGLARPPSWCIFFFLSRASRASSSQRPKSFLAASHPRLAALFLLFLFHFYPLLFFPIPSQEASWELSSSLKHSPSTRPLPDRRNTPKLPSGSSSFPRAIAHLRLSRPAPATRHHVQRPQVLHQPPHGRPQASRATKGQRLGALDKR